MQGTACAQKLATVCRTSPKETCTTLYQQRWALHLVLTIVTLRACQTLELEQKELLWRTYAVPLLRDVRPCSHLSSSYAHPLWLTLGYTVTPLTPK